MPDIPIEFLPFALTPGGIALFPRQALAVAALGLAAIVAWNLFFMGSAAGPGVGLLARPGHERVIPATLFGLLTGSTILARQFHDNRAPDVLPRFLRAHRAGSPATATILADGHGFGIRCGSPHCASIREHP